METEALILNYEERAAFALRALYAESGYKQYKMTKFEEYDLYAQNKDFLISPEVITFTDRSGKLMALKPDVTLSIVKNSRLAPGETEKLYYNENVYRPSAGTGSFKEIMQVGLECLGRVDEECLGEVLSLAAGSLKRVGSRYVLSVSHMGLLSAVLEGSKTTGGLRTKILRCIAEKNLHELRAYAGAGGIEPETARRLEKLVSLYGPAEKVLPELRTLWDDAAYLAAVEALAGVLAQVEPQAELQLDFSVLGSSKYYNGLVFQGFVKGVPDSVLSGGQYDTLMQKMGKAGGAVGFAVYLDKLETLQQREEAAE